MRLLLTVLVTVFAVAHSSHRRYRSPSAQYHPHAERLRLPRPFYSPCRNGQTPTSDGRCVHPKVSKDVYFFNAPQFEAPFSPPLYEPLPKVHYNYVFVKTSDKEKANRPVIVPPPKQKTVVYLLSETPGVDQQEVIEVPFEPTKPEVHFVGYRDGDNPNLPGGIDLQTALAHADGPGGPSHLGSPFTKQSNIGHLNSFFESGNSLNTIGKEHHGFGSPHGLSGQQKLIGHSGQHELSGFHGLSGQQELSSLHGLSGQQELSSLHGLSGQQELSGLHGLSGQQELSGLHGLSGHQELSGLHGLSGQQELSSLHGLSGHQELSAHHGHIGQHETSSYQTFSNPHESSAQYGVPDQKHGLSDPHGLSGPPEIITRQKISDIHGISHEHRIPTHYELVGPQGIHELHGAHYKDGSLHSSRGLGDGIGDIFNDRFHRDVRQHHHSLGRDQSSTRFTGVSSRGVSSGVTSRGTPSSGSSRGLGPSATSKGTSSSGASRGVSSSPPSKGTSSSGFPPGRSSTGTPRGRSSSGTPRGASSSVTSRGTSSNVSTLRGISSSRNSRVNHSNRFVPSPLIGFE